MLFRVASKMEANHPYWVVGTVQRWNGNAWEAAPGLTVTIEYKYSGWKTRHSNGSPETNGIGYFAKSFEMKAGTV